MHAPRKEGVLVSAFFCKCFCYLVQFRLAVGIERNLEAGFANGLDFPKVSRQLEEL